MAEFFLSLILAVQSFFGFAPQAEPVELGAGGLTTFQGGTGTTSPSGILYGDETIRLKTVTIGSNLTFSGGTLSATGGSGGSGTVATSTNETAGYLPYYTSTSGTPALLGQVATTSLTASSPLALSQPISVIGASASALSLDTSGTWSGNAGTASALFANGANCTAGNYPLGVDASGAVEDCTAISAGGSFPFTPTTFGATAANATNTLIGFTQGLYALASSTIGDGTQAGGLTISGGATTTGNAYFAGNVGIGTTSPYAMLSVAGQVVGQNFVATSTAATSTFAGNLAVARNITSLESVGGASNPAMVFNTNGNLWVNSESVYNFQENGVTFMNIDGIGNVTAPQGNFTTTNITPESGTNAYIGNGMRRSNPAAGFNFACGESITSISEPCFDIFPISNTTPSSGIALRVATSSNRLGVFQVFSSGQTLIGASATTSSNILNVVGGADFSGNVGIGTTSPYAKLSVVGETVAAYFTATTTSTNTFPTLLTTNATSTSLGVTNLTAADCDVKSNTDGSLYCGTDSTGSGAAFAWTPTTNYGVAVNATSTPIWFDAGLMASSTSRFVNASTTQITATEAFIGDIYGDINNDSSALLIANNWAVSDNYINLGSNFSSYYSAQSLVFDSDGTMAWSAAGDDYKFQGEAGPLYGILDFTPVAASDKTFSYPNVTGTIGVGVATTSGSLSYWTANSGLGAVATGTVSAGSSAITVTAGRSAIGGALAIDCATATSGQNGCLSSTDWSTFNNKQATISATWPIILSGAALSFGWATTSQPSSSNLFVSNGANGFYGVATTSATCGSGVTCTGFNVLGSANPSFALTALGSPGVLGAVTATIPTVQATSTLYGAVQNGMVLAGLGGSLQYVATTTFSTGLTYAAGNVTFDGGASPGGSLGGTWASPTIDDLFLLNNGDVGTGNYDFGGATFFEIPNGTGPTADDPGEIAHDTTDNQLILDDFVFARATERIWGVTVASTSPYMIGGTNLSVPDQADGYTMTSITCKVTSGTSVAIIITDGTNATESITCDADGAADDGTIANAAVTAGEDMYIDFGTVTGAVDTVSISVFGQWTRE